jgi:hypothetical protein
MSRDAIDDLGWVLMIPLLPLLFVPPVTQLYLLDLATGPYEGKRLNPRRWWIEWWAQAIIGHVPLTLLIIYWPK